MGAFEYGGDMLLSEVAILAGETTDGSPNVRRQEQGPQASDISGVGFFDPPVSPVTPPNDP